MGVVEQLPREQKPYSTPRPIEKGDGVAGFSCGKLPLDDFVKQQALKNEGGGSRTYVIVSQSGEDAGAVAGYYTLAAGAVSREDAPGWAKRNMPNPLPVLVLGRLAVDSSINNDPSASICYVKRCSVASRQRARSACGRWSSMRSMTMPLASTYSSDSKGFRPIAEHCTCQSRRSHEAFRKAPCGRPRLCYSQCWLIGHVSEHAPRQFDRLPRFFRVSRGFPPITVGSVLHARYMLRHKMAAS